jgi:hypothetical protein
LLTSATLLTETGQPSWTSCAGSFPVLSVTPLLLK